MCGGVYLSLCSFSFIRIFHQLVIKYANPTYSHQVDNPLAYKAYQCFYFHLRMLICITKCKAHVYSNVTMCLLLNGKISNLPISLYLCLFECVCINLPHRVVVLCNDSMNFSTLTRFL